MKLFIPRYKYYNFNFTFPANRFNNDEIQISVKKEFLNKERCYRQFNLVYTNFRDVISQYFQ